VLYTMYSDSKRLTTVTQKKRTLLRIRTLFIALYINGLDNVKLKFKSMRTLYIF